MDFATPAKFDVYDEPNNVAHLWERYVKSVKIYLAAKGINAAPRQRAILLHCAGSDVQDIAENNITRTREYGHGNGLCNFNKETHRIFRSPKQCRLRKIPISPMYTTRG